MEMYFYLSPICTIRCSDNVLNKINIIFAAAGLWGINVSDEYFHVRGRVIFGDVLLFIPNLAQFSFVQKKKTERQTDKQFKLNCYKRKRKKKKKKKQKKKKKKKNKNKKKKKAKTKTKTKTK